MDLMSLRTATRSRTAEYSRPALLHQLGTFSPACLPDVGLQSLVIVDADRQAKMATEAALVRGLDPDWRYQLESSIDLSTWQSVGALLATNSIVEFNNLPLSSSTLFYRAVTLP